MQVAKTYGKVFHFWQYDRGDTLPLGLPQLMMSFPEDGQLNPNLAASEQQPPSTCMCFITVSKVIAFHLLFWMCEFDYKGHFLKSSDRAASNVITFSTWPFLMVPKLSCFYDSISTIHHLQLMLSFSFPIFYLLVQINPLIIVSFLTTFLRAKLQLVLSSLNNNSSCMLYLQVWRRGQG